jgi:hypothetical protein|tara:strand:- start:164 stop:862 length:699 start_codon:yes stop_codon:yes gene_type:complete
MNYSELLTNIRDFTEVTSDVLSNSIINVFITNTENKIDRAIDGDYQRRYATSTFEANNSFLDVSGPEGGFRFVRGLQLVKSDDTRVWIEQVDTTFIDEYGVERSTTDTNFTGEPKYWANWDATTLIVAPTPNTAYTVEMWYNETPERLGNGSGTTSTTTFISNNAPEVLLYGTLSEAYSFLKNIQDMQLYEAKFTSALKLFADEQMGRKRRDEYVDGVLRIPLTSMDPKGGS